MKPWSWFTGLRLSTRQARELAAFHAHAAALALQAAHAQKREAQRILAILSEPLKDWDLDDFPKLYAIATGPRPADWLAVRLEWEHVHHLNAVIQAYETVRTEAAHARMTITANDKLRGQGWADQPIPTTRPAPRDPRRLP